MADLKITALTSIGTGSDPILDPLVIVDVSDLTMGASGTTKKASINQLLSSSPTAGGNFTITGALTTSGNGRIGTDGLGFGRLTVSKATSAAFLNLSLAATSGYTELMFTNFNDNTGASGYSSYIRSNTNAASNYASDLVFGTSAASTGSPVERYKLASDGVATWSNVGGVAGTAMTLNSTGLGVGTTNPQGKLTVSNGTIFVGSEANTSQQNNLLNGYGYRIGTTLYGNVSIRSTYANSNNSANLEFYTALNGVNTDKVMEITNTGNLGLGIVPSAWKSTFKVIDVGSRSAFVGNPDSVSTDIFHNLYVDSGGAAIHKTLGAGSFLRFEGNVFKFLQAVSASAGATASLTTGMTLDASGQLGIGVAPSYRLDVLGSGTISGRFKTTGAINALFLEDSGTTAGSLYVGSSGNEFRVVTGSNVALAIDVNRSTTVGPATLATTATDGFFYIPGCAGVPTGVPTAKAGRIPMAVDTTNNRFYMYVNSAWRYAALV